LIVLRMGISLKERCHEWAGKFIDQARSSPLVNEAHANPKTIIYVVIALCCTIWLVSRGIRFLKKPAARRPATPDLEKPALRSFKAPQREPGG
jgi:hypothetical protein